MPWFVLYTKSRAEKMVAERLRDLNMEVYCPLKKTRRKWSDRVKIVEEPLFRSYCFVKLEEHERKNVFVVPGVSHYLFWLNRPAIVRDEEIDIIKRLLNEVDHSCLSLNRMRSGDRLTIKSGSFADLSGRVIRQQGTVVSLTLDSLQLVISVDISKTLVAV
ncbi:UpxY family transcription antiterminator [Spirosoma litoris]